MDTEAEILWEERCCDGLAAYGARRTENAIISWRAAALIAERFDGDDPRRAATQSNLGLALAIERRLDEADAACQSAAAAWQAARSWVATMSADGTARSSTFHHRLELKHQDSFAEHYRRRHQTLCAGAASLTSFNHGLVLIALDRGPVGIALVGEAVRVRCASFGASNPELLSMIEITADLAPETVPAEVAHARTHLGHGECGRSMPERWRMDRPPQMNDRRRLLGAVCMTGLMARDDLP